MTKKSIDLNLFLANLAALNIKVHNLHWNVVGPNFLEIHKATELVYQMLQLQFDETAELMKSQEMFPLASLAEYADKTTVIELESRDYSEYEALEELDTECQNITDNALQIHEYAEKNGNIVLANLIEKYLEMYAKVSWQIRAMLKGAGEGNEEDAVEEDDVEIDETEE